jgi:hypothetical protein
VKRARERGGARRNCVGGKVAWEVDDEREREMDGRDRIRGRRDGIVVASWKGK